MGSCKCTSDVVVDLSVYSENRPLTWPHCLVHGNNVHAQQRAVVVVAAAVQLKDAEE